MAISYKPLFKLLIDRDLKKLDLIRKVGIGTTTLAKLSKGQPVAMSILERICKAFGCQYGDIVEYIPDPPDPMEIVPPKTRRKKNSPR